MACQPKCPFRVDNYFSSAKDDCLEINNRNQVDEKLLGGSWRVSISSFNFAYTYTTLYPGPFVSP